MAYSKNNTLGELKDMFKQGDLLTKLIFINCGVFVVVALANLVCYLFQCGVNPHEYLALPAHIEMLAYRPWTVLTYMLLHEQFLHFICNVLMLYWTGRLFLGVTYRYNQRDLVNVFVLGGLGGALFFLLAYNAFPVFTGKLYFSSLEGASASVMALLVAAAATQPDAPIRLPLLTEVRLKWLALALFLISVLTGFTDNAGGCFAHLGGGVAGFLFAHHAKKGRNIAGWIGTCIDFASRLWDQLRNALGGITGKKGGKPRFRVVHGNTSQRPATDAEYNMRKKADAAEIDAILDKIKISGYASLSPEEKQKLFDAGSNR